MLPLNCTISRLGSDAVGVVLRLEQLAVAVAQNTRLIALYVDTPGYAPIDMLICYGMRPSLPSGDRSVTLAWEADGKRMPQTWLRGRCVLVHMQVNTFKCMHLRSYACMHAHIQKSMHLGIDACILTELLT